MKADSPFLKKTGDIKKRLLSVQELGDYLGLSIHTVYAMVSQRRIPFVKVGRLTRFDLNKIEDFIVANSVEIRDENPKD
jgi:DNA binding domain, excisionase family